MRLGAVGALRACGRGRANWAQLLYSVSRAFSVNHRTNFRMTLDGTVTTCLECSTRRFVVRAA